MPTSEEDALSFDINISFKLLLASCVQAGSRLSGVDELAVSLYACKYTGPLIVYVFENKWN